MTDIILVTGFLGSGKTTFIRSYARHLMDEGKQIGILENDFGAVNVDMMLLQDLEGDQCELEMIAGGCDKDCHKRRFKTKLIAMGMCGYDKVIIEPSGIFELEEFFDLIQEEPLNRWYQIGAVVAVVDAKLSEDLSKEARYLLGSQASQAGTILLSKLEGFDEEKKEQQALLTMQKLTEYIEEFQGHKTLELGKNVLAKEFNALEKEDFDALSNSGFSLESCEKMWFSFEDAFQSLYFMEKKLTTEQMEAIVKPLFSDSVKFGNVSRIKGFLKEQEQWYELNATRETTSLGPIENGQDVVIIIGQDLQKDSIEKLFDSYKK